MAEVSTRKRGEKWEYRFELASQGGKRFWRTKGGFRTKAEALKAGREALNEYENGGLSVSPSEMSVSDFLDLWLKVGAKERFKESTTAGYEKRIRLYIKPVLGEYRIRSINRPQLQEFITDFSNRGFSRNTVTSIRGILTGAFDWAEDNGMISRSPAYRLKMPGKTEVKQTTEPHVYIEQDMIEKIFKRFPEGTTSHIPMMIAYHCGLRLGETFALLWDDIDFENKTMTIARQVQWSQDRTRDKANIKKANGGKERGNGFWYFAAPKYESYRTIELDDILLSLLSREKARQEKARTYYEELYSRYYSDIPVTEINEDNPYQEIRIQTQKTENELLFVCRRENGEYTSPRTMQHASSVIHKQLEFPEFDFHSLRHTHATMLRDNHAPDIYVQERLGHSNIETTKNIYQDHATKASTKEGVEVLSEMF